MKLDADTLPIRNNEQDGQFEIEVEGDVALLAYYGRGESSSIHTRSCRRRSRGTGSREGSRGTPSSSRVRTASHWCRCPFVREYLREHPEYADLVKRGAIDARR